MPRTARVNSFFAVSLSQCLDARKLPPPAPSSPLSPAQTLCCHTHWSLDTSINTLYRYSITRGPSVVIKTVHCLGQEW